MQNNAPKSFDLFLLFLRKKINDGERQVDIAKSNEVNKSTSYINKLFLKNPKNCPIDVQRNIASYFGLTYEQMIDEGKSIYKKLNQLKQTEKNKIHINKDVTERRSQEPEDLVHLLNFISAGIIKSSEKRKLAEGKLNKILRIIDHIDSAICITTENMIIEHQNANHRSIFGYLKGENYVESLWKEREEYDIEEGLKTKKFVTITQNINDRYYNVNVAAMFDGNNICSIIESVRDITAEKLNSSAIAKKINLYKSIFSELNEEITFFNAEREFVFSNNRWGLLNDIDIESKPSMEEFIFSAREKIVNFDEVLDMITVVHTSKKQSEINVEFLNGKIFHFTIVPLVQEDIFLGILIINAPV